MLIIFACYVLTYVWDAVSIFNQLSRMFLSIDFAFRISDWTGCHGPQIISSCVSGLATDSPCGVWGREWTTCLLHDSPLFGSHFKMRVGVYVWSEISYIHHYFLPRFMVSCMKLVIFYSIITFSYTKYVVHSYTVDIVFTLSYFIIGIPKLTFLYWNSPLYHQWIPLTKGQ